MSTSDLVITVVGAGGKMGLRISANLQRSGHAVRYCENHPPAQARVTAEGRELSDTATAAADSDVVVLAVPDVLLGEISAQLVPLLKPGAVVLTLDPAAAYAGVLARRDDIHLACAHPCHPSVFLERTTSEEYADTFGGVAAAQDVVAALESGGDAVRARVEDVVRIMYGPVLDVHWVTVKQLAVLEPTLVETVACMISGLLRDALHETVHTVGVPEAAARAMLFGHIQVALSNSLRGSNPFSEACLIAMDYGRETIVRDDWRRIFDDAELDSVIARMLRIDAVRPAR
ncbi:phosphogluconate dehydrogenase C-terminal domain-containing protein [Micromonospora haikouensis]|uniref:phosphogluconate dehydrogenase C-terminal domain-containing protein n=1 Tax=Micromonospora haikouensis TaxID=686309 RepID=UPI003D70DBE7